MTSVRDALSILQTNRDHPPLVLQLLVFGIMAVALASPVPGGHHHEHHIIHVPYKVHTIHHHHTKKIHVPVHHVEKVPVHIPYPVHHVEKVPVPVPVHHVEKVAVPVPVIHKVPVAVPIHEEKHHDWF
ncbi:hypothetical protein ALC56_13573 [Trachymyrmex septentrionalis]|uniref:Uncharacterized protein n=1 Tax=Trachymyrmex septentrionalis TaxID=34720 RepID=A0A195EVA7_9HYME|nr:hypothetical protein ALC56_13573 [Trachymyrmex septentrionalis]